VTQGLDGFPLLSELSADERRALEGCLEGRELDSGSVLYRPGEEADALYFVIEGAVAIRDGGQNLAELAAGEVLGALSIVSIGKRECEVVGATATKLLTLTREGYLRLRDDLPPLALRLQEAILRSFSALVRGVLEDSRATPTS
jgi:CRP-like cAMP-binding protein